MADKKTTLMCPEEIQPTWEKLLILERKLQKNLRLCHILQPVGVVIFALNLLLATGNYFLFFGGKLVDRYFMTLPVLPSLVEGLPRSSAVGMALFTLAFVFLVPLAISGAIFGVITLTEKRKPQDIPLLTGSLTSRAKALVYKAEEVYELRRRITTWSAYVVPSVLTALMALPILAACIGFATGEDSAVLELALGCLALLLCVFVLFWIYALLYKAFSLLNALFYLSPGEWTLYQQYQRLDAYWESVDPREFARREQAAQAQKRHRNTDVENDDDFYDEA